MKILNSKSENFDKTLDILLLKRRKKIPILVGGTGLYFKSLTDGLVNIPNIPNKFTDKIKTFLENAE